MNRLVRTGLVVAVLVMAGCSSGIAWDPFGSDGDDRRSRSISLYAQNENDEDVVLYLLSASGVQRVGSVAPERSQTFFVDWDDTRELRVRVEILAGPRYTTNALPTVSPGDRVELWVPNDAERSVIRRR